MVQAYFTSHPEEIAVQDGLREYGDILGKAAALAILQRLHENAGDEGNALSMARIALGMLLSETERKKPSPEEMAEYGELTRSFEEYLGTVPETGIAGDERFFVAQSLNYLKRRLAEVSQ